MANETLQTFAQGFCDCWANAGRDPQAFSDYFSEDVRVELMVCGATLAEVRGPFNKAQWRVQTAKEATVADLIVVIDRVWGDEHAIIMELTGDLEINGIKYNNKYCYILEMDTDGKIKNLRLYLDTLYAQQIFAMLQQSSNAMQWQD